jgi:CheY-like chemotaxis protein
MSTQESTCNFPFISNLVSSRVAERSAHARQRSVHMKEKAICLDDDPLSLRLVEHLLKKRFEVISCATLDAAIRATKQHAVDLFLCDYHLGERFTGAQAFEILSGSHGFNPTHRILITSYPSPDIEAESLRVGFDRVFPKPLRRDFQSYCLDLWIPPVSQPAAVG